MPVIRPVLASIGNAQSRVRVEDEVKSALAGTGRQADRTVDQPAARVRTHAPQIPSVADATFEIEVLSRSRPRESARLDATEVGSNG
jgi:hypothetical protein